MLRLSIAALILAPSPTALADPWQAPPAAYAYRPAKSCAAEPTLASAAQPGPPGQARYPVCSEQMQIFKSALDAARAEGKLLIVEFGATWCSWCRSLQDQMPTAAILGARGGRLDYGNTFRRVSIGISTLADRRQTDVPSGRAVLDLVMAHAPGAKLRAVPLLAIIDPNDASRTIVRNVDDLAIEATGRHDPVRVREVLAAAHDAIRGNGPRPTEPTWLRRKLDRLWGRLFG